MNMTLSNGIRLELGNHLGQGYVECTLPAGLPLDTAAFGTICNDPPGFLCPFTVNGINGETIVRYDFGNRVSLAYLSGTFSPADFSKLLHRLVDPLLDGEDWFLDYRNFCFDPQYIYLDRSTMEIFYLYFPIQEPCASDGEIKDLFAGLLERCPVPAGSQLTSRLYQCLMRRDFSLYDFRNALDLSGSPQQPSMQQVPPAQQQPMRQVPPAQQPPMQQVPPAQRPPMQQAPSAQQPNPNGWSAAPSAPGTMPGNPGASRGQNPGLSLGSSSDEDDNLEAILSGGKPPKAEKAKKKEKKSGGFRLFDNKPQPPAPVSERREFLGGAAAAPGPLPTPMPVAPPSQTSNSDTLIGGGGLPESGALLRYIGSFRNPQTGGCPPQIIDIRIHDGAFRIGRFDVSKGYQQSDFEFAPDINAVSRFHARIEERDGTYYLIHLGSAAGTYVNGQPLAANVPVPLKNGDRVSFSSKGVDYLFTAQ